MWMRIKRHLKYHFPGWFPGTPKMQMYAIPQKDVTASISAAGAQVLARHADQLRSAHNIASLAELAQLLN